MLKSTEVKRASTGTTRTAGGSAVRRTGGSRAGVVRSRRPGGRQVCSRSTASPSAADPATVFHHDNERLGFEVGEQVVHDQVSMTLVAPACFVFTRAMLKIEHRKTFAWILVVIGRSVNEAATASPDA